jgi:AcrR family transcriptional regulator
MTRNRPAPPVRASTTRLRPVKVDAAAQTRNASKGGRPRDEAKERVILDVSLALLAEVGYDRLTVEAVATPARASKTTLYRRWPGKAELVLAALDYWESGIETPCDTGALRGDLLSLATVTCRNVDGIDGALLRGLAGAVRSDPDLAAAVKRQMLDPKAPWAEGIVDRATARGELPSGVDPAPISEIVPALTVLAALQGDPLDHALAAHIVDDILLPLLRARPDSQPRTRPTRQPSPRTSR